MDPEFIIITENDSHQTYDSLTDAINEIIRLNLIEKNKEIKVYQKVLEIKK